MRTDEFFPKQSDRHCKICRNLYRKSGTRMSIQNNRFPDRLIWYERYFRRCVLLPAVDCQAAILHTLCHVSKIRNTWNTYSRQEIRFLRYQYSKETFHTICPPVSVHDNSGQTQFCLSTLLFFEKTNVIKVKEVLYGLLPTGIYTIFYLTNVLIHIYRI